MRNDAQSRAAALDVSRSFIVQAPAGSGKTELLIQRYLRLLATVDEPEQVVAITFTRKAAAEMRARVLRALGTAEHAIAGPDHERATQALALAALAADRRRGWALLEQPERLRIATLDALNASLAQGLPLLSGGIAGARVIEDAVALYHNAARAAVATLMSAAEGQRALRHVLAAVDHRIDRLEVMLVELLAKREQWLELIGDLTWVADPAEASRRIGTLVRATVNRLDELVENSDITVLLGAVVGRDRIEPKQRAPAANEWRSIAKLLLTRTGAWRRRWPRGARPASEQHELEQCSSRLQARDGVREALVAARELPDPHLDAADSAMLGALRSVLLQAVGELRVQFADRRCVDFAELALGAQLALGRVDEPSDLLLAVDRRIQHLLVDEFQDTSKSQLRLLELLTSGWEPDDGRTLFLVGDPMQSIYRFRNADVSLFLRVQQFGIGAIACDSLVLAENFRAAPALVGWVNRAFGRIFPPRDDLATGVTAFHASYTRRPPQTEDGVQYHILPSGEIADEIERIAAIVTAEHAASPERSIGVLVQSRAHLVGLRTRLQRAGLAIRAVEIDALRDEPFVQDLLGLCRALTHLGDRAAWLAVLRAPWCGLRWADLARLTEAAHEATIWELIEDPARLAAWRVAARRRAAAVREHLRAALDARGTEPFVRWIERAWRALGGPGTYEHEPPEERLDAFFGQLGDGLHGEDLLDAAALERYFATPPRQPDASGTATIELMTIHRAKGLEFDTVVLSGLNRAVRRDERQLLLWRDGLEATGQALPVVAPLRPGHVPLYDYLRRSEARRADAERARLLYVATTRARRRLHLVAGLAESAPLPGSLLAYLWPELPPESRPAPAGPAAEPPPPRYVVAPLRRLASLATELPPAVPVRSGAVPHMSLEYEWVGPAAAPIGVVVHRYLRAMAADGLAGWTPERVAATDSTVRAELQLLGVEPETVASAALRVRATLLGVLDDPRGRWVLGPRAEARSELGLGLVIDHVQSFVRLDRTFVDAGVRWIIDYKTGSHEGGALDAFLSAEIERYRAQLERYVQAWAGRDARPVRVGLYFPLIRAFRDWQPGA